jgi:hypothetical protein
MTFRPVFIAVVIAFGLIVSAFLVNRARPRVEVDQPSADFVRASGKCAECHSQQQYSIVHEYELSRHAQKGVNCLDCHQPAASQTKKDHHGFVISAKLTVYFDLWHYDGRTSKHGAFMGGADFVQWHGNYPMLARTVEIRAQAEELRRFHGKR